MYLHLQGFECELLAHLIPAAFVQDPVREMDILSYITQ